MTFPKRISNWLGALFLAGSLRAESSLETLDREVSALYTRSQDAIVRVHARRASGRCALLSAPEHRIGTGFFVDAEGRLLTAGTIVEEAETCWVDYRGQRRTARLLGRDARTNLALLQVETDRSSDETNRISFLTLGDSGGLRIGCMVVAVGFPYNMPSAPVVGFVTGFDIQQGARIFPTRHVRASCRLSPGQSGSPLFNVRGEVVGVTLAARSDDQCHALPVNAVRKVYTDLRDHGTPQRAFVGVNVGERQTNESATDSWQVFIQTVSANTPAAAAGIRNGDVLCWIHTNEVRRLADVLDQVFLLRANDPVSFSVIRNGKRMEFTLTAAAAPADSPVLNVLPVAGQR